MSRNMIYTFSGNQLPVIDNKKNTEKMTKCAEVMGEEGGLFTLVVREKFAEGKQRLLALLFSMFKLFQCAVNFPTLLTDYFKVPSVKRYSWHHLLTLFYTGGNIWHKYHE